MRTPRIAPALVLLLALSASNRAAAQQEDVELTARTHFAAGEYQQALDIYAKLYAQTLHPTYLRNVGRCYQNMGKPDEAISAFREYLRKAENLEPKRRAEVEGFIHEMEDLKRRREAPRPLTAVPAEAPSMSAPIAGPVAAPSAPPPTGRADDSSRIEASLKAQSPAPEDQESSPVYARWWFWTAIAAVAVGSVAAAVVLSAGSGTPTAQTTFSTMPANLK